MSDEMPKEIWAWEYADNDYHNGTGHYENGWHKDGNVVTGCTKYTRTDERAEMQAAIVELRKGLTRLRKTIEVNADDVFWMHDMGACHESAHDCIDNLLENTEKWSEHD